MASDPNAAIRKRHAEIPTEPMFDVEAMSADREPPARKKYAKSVGFGHCPKCQEPKLGKIRASDGLVWRPHYKTLFGGARILCAASGEPAPTPDAA